MSEKLRLALYTAVAGALSVLVALGTIDQGQSDAILATATAALSLAAAIALIVATRHVTPDTWSALRGSLYVTVSAALAAFGLFGLVSPEWAAPALETLDAILQAVGVVVLTLAARKVPYVPERALEA